MKTKFLALSSMLALTLLGCGGGDGDKDAGTDAATDAGNDTPAGETGGETAGETAGETGGETAGDAPTDGSSAGDPVRGKYIVDHVAACGDCHTPRNMDGSPDLTKYLAGVDCLFDVDADPSIGCISSRNLTNHMTGLMSRTDSQIIDMFTKGMRPGGKAMSSVMPYYVFGNMTMDDKLAVVAYLRTVPGVDHTVAANQPPFDAIPAPAPTLDPKDIPSPPDAYPEKDKAEKGRYLATMAGVCIECHTPDAAPGPGVPIDMTKVFQGGKEFPSALLGLPSPPFPMIIYTRNLTPDDTGLKGWTAADIKNELKMGVDRDGKGICPPMPVGPMGAFGGLTDEDAENIGYYVLSLPPAKTDMYPQCVAPGP